MNDRLFLITEDIYQDFEIVKEAVQGATGCKNAIKYKIRGPYFLCEEKNANNRIYPKSIVAPEIQKYINEKVNTHSSLGELNHSETFDVDPNRACHMVTSLKEDGNYYLGESEILTGHPCGDILASFINHGCRFGVSSRSAGKLNESRGIVEKMFLSCWDAVLNPSISRYVDGILESKQFMIDAHGIIVESAYNKFDKMLEKLPNTVDAKKAVLENAVDKFLKSI